MQMTDDESRAPREVEHPRDRVSSSATLGIALGENYPLVPALFLHSRESQEERTSSRREESSFVTGNLLRRSIIFNRENKSFDSIIRGIFFSRLPQGLPLRILDERKESAGLFVRLKNLGSI